MATVSIGGGKDLESVKSINQFQNTIDLNDETKNDANPTPDSSTNAEVKASPAASNGMYFWYDGIRIQNGYCGGNFEFFISGFVNAKVILS